MTYNVILQTFEGPLDLLLHLISKAKINIEDVSLTEITEQYLNYIEQMRKFDIEIASDFLVMAATLLHIKSRALLPKYIVEEDGEPDPEEELIRRISEYKKYREISEFFKEKENLYAKVFYKLPEEIIDKKEEPQLFMNASGKELFSALIKLLDKKRFIKNELIGHEIQKEPISIEQRIEELKNAFDQKPEQSFFDLFSEDYNRFNIIITFLALLEMLKLNFIQINQEKPFENIMIRRRNK